MAIKFKPLFAILAAAVVGTALTVTPAAPSAPAEASVYNCPNARACMWVGGNFTGNMWSGASSVPRFTSWNNVASSIANRSTRTPTWWTAFNYGGLSWTLSPGGSADLSGGIYNDNFSSLSM